MSVKPGQPQSGRLDALRRRPDHTIRAAVARRLRAEAQQLLNAGIDVQIIEPDAPTLDALGINPIDRTRTARVVPHAFLATGGQIDPTLTVALRTANRTSGVRCNDPARAEHPVELTSEHHYRETT